MASFLPTPTLYAISIEMLIIYFWLYNFTYIRNFQRNSEEIELYAYVDGHASAISQFMH